MIKMVTKLTVLLLLFGVITTNAQWKDNSGWFSMNVGYTPLTNPESKNTMDGWSANFTFEKFLKGSPFALGMNFAWLNSNDDYFRGSERIIINFSTFMLSLTSKYVFVAGDMAYYIGLGLGWQNTTGTGNLTDQAGGTKQDITQFSGVAIQVPIGFNGFVSDNTFVGLNIVPFWGDGSAYDSSINYMINATVGFQMPTD